MSGVNDFRLKYEICPIILNGGLASGVPGGMLPVLSLTQPAAFGQGATGSTEGVDIDTVARFEPLAGSTLEEISVGLYPFANQFVAGNAIIFEPLKLSMLMIAPAPGESGYSEKLASFTALKTSLDQHMTMGGTFTIATPAYLYVSCLLTGLRDVTPPDSRQVQVNWQWDFIQPLLDLNAANAAQNTLLSKISNGTMVQGDPPKQGGTLNTAGAPQSGVGPSLLPSLTPLPGASSGGPVAAQFNP